VKVSVVEANAVTFEWNYRSIVPILYKPAKDIPQLIIFWWIY